MTTATSTYLSRLQRQIDDLTAGPLTADSEKVLEGLTELHQRVSLLPTSSIGWSDKSYPSIGSYNDECAPEFEGYDDEYVFPVSEIDMDSHCDDWLEEDSLDSVATEETFLDGESFLDDESLMSPDDKQLEDDASAPHDSPQALAGDKAPAEGDAGHLAFSALDPTAAP